MKKIFKFLGDNVLFIATLFLLAFIPLYPKLPLLDVKNTWVYIRAEDFVVFLVLAVWGLLLISKKVTLKTPLTIPILAFWFIGAIATIHGVIIIFPQVANVFPNVAFLSYLRHIEYMSLFFIAFSAMRDKKFLQIVIIVLVASLLAVVAYGFGQKYLGFPAYLTGNEEFAKGVPITLSALSRVPSTFAGHYDLAAYLVLVLPILASLIFGYKNLLIKIGLAVSVVLGFVMLFLTVSRVSFAVFLVALFFVLAFQKKKFAFLTVPVVILLSIAFLILSPSLLSRFGNTVSEVEVVINGDTGESIGHVEYVPVSYLDDKTLKQRKIANTEQLGYAVTGELDQIREASPSGEVIFELLPAQIPLVKATNISTGENLPQGTGYINLSLSPVVGRLGSFFYELGPDVASESDAEVILLHGNFLVKKASAYDLSFTTRTQGEWPHAIEAFQENILLGSGYGTVSLAVDNNYLRILGEVGALGMASFAAIFIGIGLYIRRVFPQIESKAARSFVLGFGAGVIGLALNATLIDVFEASKVAFVLWLLAGVTVGTLALYDTKKVDVLKELKKAAVSSYAIVVYILVGVAVMLAPSLGNYFVGDDFTWFRWAAECTIVGGAQCGNVLSTILNYFTDSEGFFFRPGPKTYFHMMYDFFWLNQIVYHFVSIVLHFVVAVLFFFLADRLLKNRLLAGLAAFLFLVMSGYLEVVYWISATQYLFYAVLALSSLLLFIKWDDTQKIFYLVSSIIVLTLGMFFHEVGVVVPLILIAYKVTFGEVRSYKKLLKVPYIALFVPVVLYLLLRLVANSHWSGGDYSYNLMKLPFNFVGNIIGYMMLTVAGPIALSPYETVRSLARENLPVSIIAGLALIAALYFVYKKIFLSLEGLDKKIVYFSLSLFVISLLPFLPLGNISSRYSYVATLAAILLFVLLVRKLYGYLLGSGREIALLAVVSFLSIFSLFHIIQAQQTQLDWHGAGEKARKFFIAINNSYDNYWSTIPMELHFVNVPVKNGEAWVFPVGIGDALWFAFQNENLTVVTHGSLDEALDAVGGYTSKTVRIFEFEGDDVREVKRLAPNPLLNSTPSAHFN